MRLSTLLAALPPDLEPTCRLLGSPDDDPAIHGIATTSRRSMATIPAIFGATASKPALEFEQPW